MGGDRVVTSESFGAALAAAGLVDGLDTVRRVVIVAEVRKPLLVRVERFGTERWTHAAGLLEGAEVTEAPRVIGYRIGDHLFAPSEVTVVFAEDG